MSRIEADGDTLMRQAPMTANSYLMEAIASIDKALGAGYAAAHPELIASFIQASALDFGASILARAIEAIADRQSE